MQTEEHFLCSAIVHPHQCSALFSWSILHTLTCVRKNGRKDLERSKATWPPEKQHVCYLLLNMETGLSSKWFQRGTSYLWSDKCSHIWQLFTPGLTGFRFFYPVRTVTTLHTQQRENMCANRTSVLGAEISFQVVRLQHGTKLISHWRILQGNWGQYGTLWRFYKSMHRVISHAASEKLSNISVLWWLLHTCCVHHLDIETLLKN